MVRDPLMKVWQERAKSAPTAKERAYYAGLLAYLKQVKTNRES